MVMLHALVFPKLASQTRSGTKESPGKEYVEYYRLIQKLETPFE